MCLYVDCWVTPVFAERSLLFAQSSAASLWSDGSNEELSSSLARGGLQGSGQEAEATMA